MRGKKTDKDLIDEIAELMMRHRPAEVVRIMAGRLPRRTVYRIISNLRMEDERRRVEQAERFHESLRQRTMSRLEIWQSRKRFKRVKDLPSNPWRVRSY